VQDNGRYDEFGLSQAGYGPAGPAVSRETEYEGWPAGRSANPRLRGTFDPERDGSPFATSETAGDSGTSEYSVPHPRAGGGSVPAVSFSDGVDASEPAFEPPSFGGGPAGDGRAAEPTPGARPVGRTSRPPEAPPVDPFGGYSTDSVNEAYPRSVTTGEYRSYASRNIPRPMVDYPTASTGSPEESPQDNRRRVRSLRPGHQCPPFRPPARCHRSGPFRRPGRPLRLGR
jgi:hypothetical protein